MTASPVSGSSPDDRSADSTEAGTTWAARLRHVPARVWLALILIVIAIVFIVQNRERVGINLVGYTVSAPLWLLTTGVLVIGILIGMLLSRLTRRHRAKT